MRLVVTVAVIPAHVVDVAFLSTFHKTVVTLAASAAGILPLLLCRQPEAHPRLLVQLFDELLTIVPADLLHWTVRAFISEIRRVIPHNCLPLRLGDRRTAQLEVASGDIHHLRVWLARRIIFFVGIVFTTAVPVGDYFSLGAVKHKRESIFVGLIMRYSLRNYSR